MNQKRRERMLEELSDQIEDWDWKSLASYAREQLYTYFESLQDIELKEEWLSFKRQR